MFIYITSGFRLQTRGWRASTDRGHLRRVGKDSAGWRVDLRELGWEVTTGQWQETDDLLVFLQLDHVSDGPTAAYVISTVSQRASVSQQTCFMTCGLVGWSPAGVGSVFLGPVAVEAGIIDRLIFLWKLLSQHFDRLQTWISKEKSGFPNWGGPAVFAPHRLINRKNTWEKNTLWYSSYIKCTHY